MILRVFWNGHVDGMGILRGSDAARSWGASAVLGVPPMSNWRGFPHERLHQDTGILPVSCLFPGGQDAHSTPINS
ncbi:MAG: hypothetical protein F6K26_42635 [Moorea sp. SIO2I5]|nr:hypothetical protein [Moorena sp. SIO2I5]